MTDLAPRPPLRSIAAKEWDVLVIGGGITGAGIMREIARLGKRVLLVERGDFASGTSSRSSKMMHGGFHYLERLQVGLVRDAVHEREEMLRSGSQLAEEVNFFYLSSTTSWPAWVIEFGLTFYDLLAGRFSRGHGVELAKIRELAPGIDIPRSTAAFNYHEARVDDARLVLRVLMEGCRMGGVALNYVEALDPILDPAGEVIGARLLECETGSVANIRARATINATGPWSDRLRVQVGARPRMRLVRGSHLIFPKSRLPLTQVIAISHPDSKLPLYFVPWEGVIFVGSTDEEESESNGLEARISAEEVNYLLKAVQMLFPNAHITHHDILCTFSGLRPIVDGRRMEPAKASREDVIWMDSGMLTVTGGKLTTFRSMALRTLRKLRERMPDLPTTDRALPIFEPLPTELLASNTHFVHNHITRYGPEGLSTILAASPDEQSEIPGFGFSKAELRWVLEKEAVRHLDDLLLRRFRVGLTLPEGGLPYIERIRVPIQRGLGWDDSRWQTEAERYAEIYQRIHSVPKCDWTEPFPQRLSDPR